MQVIGPQTLTVGQATTIVDPAEKGGPASAACQVQNASPYQLAITAAGDVLSIQPFTAQTFEISGLPIAIVPLASTSAQPCTITLTFLLTAAPSTGVQLPSGTWVEAPPQQDGPLTAAAIASALSTQGSVDLLATGGPTAITTGTINTLIGGGGVTALHSYASLIFVSTYSAVPPAALFVLGQRAPSSGGTILNFPQIPFYPNGPGVMNDAMLPFACQAGDKVNVSLIGTANGNISWVLYGSTQPASGLPLIRSDGRAYPIGIFAAEASGVNTGTTNLVAAPASPLRVLVKTVIGSHTTPAGTSTGITATINGVAVNLIRGNTPGGASDLSLDFESGLLLDVATAVTWTAGGAGTFMDARIIYDLVV